VGHIYLRGKVWWSQVYVNGVAVRESCQTRDRAEAKRALKERELQALRGERPVLGKAMWLDASSALLAHYHAYGSRNPVEAGYRLKHLNRHFGGYKLVDIDSAAITAYVVNRRAQGAAPGTIGIELATLRKALRLAHEQGKLATVPVIRSPKPAPARAGFVERHELESICRELSDDLQLVVRIAFLYGWRVRSEVLPLTKAQVDLEIGTLRLEPGRTKNGDARIVYLTPELKAELIEQLARVRSLERELGQVIHFVFPHLRGRFKGQRWTTIQWPWQKACARAGVAGRRPHDLRRSAVRNMVNVGISQRVAQAMTGHRTTSVFMRYQIVVPDDLRNAARRLSDSYKTTGSGHNFQAH
jgi:integrase